MDQKLRYNKIDGIRGAVMISMILYHTLWDIVYIFGFDIPWYRSAAAYLWQQSICWTFIIISGFCWSMGRQKLRRGITVLCAGILISLVTAVIMPQDMVVFGILTLIGSCTIIMIPSEHVLRRLSPFAGITLFSLLFFLMYKINDGYLGFCGINLFKLPSGMYRNLFTTWLGFPMPEFTSADYFSFMPWCFLFVLGYFLYRLAEQRHLLPHLEKGKCMPLERIGRNSLIIYILHQPVIYGILYVLFTVII